MILFFNRARDVQVLRTKNGGLGVDNIGILMQPDNGEENPNWILNVCGADLGISGDFSGTEKLCIIEMLDKLNNFGHRHSDLMQSRWREIVGRSDAKF